MSASHAASETESPQQPSSVAAPGVVVIVEDLRSRSLAEDGTVRRLKRCSPCPRTSHEIVVDDVEIETS